MKTINTFINGFDKIIQKGIPVGSVVLIAGITGSMKSAISSYILYKNALEDRKSIFVSLQHSETEIIEQMKNFGWNYDDVKGDMYILDYKKIESATALPYKKLFKEELVDTLLLMKQTYNYELVVIDCLTALDIISEFKNPRIEFFKFFEWLKKLDTTSFLVSEMLQDSKSYSKHSEEFLVDGIIHMNMVVLSGVKIQRRIRCVKMRNVYHSTDWFTFFYSDGMFHVTEVMT